METSMQIFFQHEPYLDSFNEERSTELAALTGVHIEPLGIYSDKVEDLAELTNKAEVAIPNDVTNGGRALLLLQQAGVIELDESAKFTPTVNDITKNELNLSFHELEAALLSRSLKDVDAAVINGNYALEADLIPTADALFLEGEESPYVNILAVRYEDIKDPKLNKLAEALRSDIVQEFIKENYSDSVVPAFNSIYNN